MRDEEVAGARMREAAAAMVAGLERAVPGWVQREVDRLLEVWGGLDAAGRTAAREEAGRAGAAAAHRVAAELGALLALDPEKQTATPLEVVRGAVREPTAVLAAAGVPDVARDPFEERAWPEDRYGLVPRTMRDLDEDLAAVHFAWGVAKAEVLRLRRRVGGPGLGEA